ncbi:MAG: hypothetical protein ACRDUA_06105 [Micromonosporaceae bacterium]
MATNQRTSAEPLLLPVGHFTGVFPTEHDPRQRIYQVRKGDDLIGLPDAAFAVWGLCHGRSNQPADQPWTRTAVLTAAENGGVDDVGRLLRELVNDDLASEVVPGSRQAIGFAQAYRLCPTLLGLGNSAKDPGTYEIGLFGTPMLQVSRNIFEVWRWAPVTRNLWEVCQLFTEAERTHGETNPESVDPEVVLTGVLGALHGLFTAGAAYLDVTE